MTAYGPRAILAIAVFLLLSGQVFVIGAVSVGPMENAYCSSAFHGDPCLTESYRSLAFIMLAFWIASWAFAILLLGSWLQPMRMAAP